jgi:hypothetical protein
MMSVAPHDGDSYALLERVAAAAKRYEELFEEPVFDDEVIERMEFRRHRLFEVLAEAEQSGLVH